MRKVLYLCLLLSIHMTIKGTLFFWTNNETHMCGLHYNSNDICMRDSVCSGDNHVDIPLFREYIETVLLPKQSAQVAVFLKRLLHMLSLPYVIIPYRVDDGYVPNEIQVIGSASAAKPSAPKPLTTDQKKEKILNYLIALGLARPNAIPLP